MVEYGDRPRHVIRIDLRRLADMPRRRTFPDTRPSLLGALRDDEQPDTAWRRFFEAYAPSVFRVARYRGLTNEDADDVVQQVMLVVARHIGDFRYDRDRGRFRDWIRTVTNNKVRDLLRRDVSHRQHVRPGGLDAETLEDPDGERLWEQEWQMQDLLHCLKIVGRDIAPHRLEAFRLYVLEGVSAEEAGERTGMTRAHVYVTRADVIKRLRKALEQLREA